METLPPTPDELAEPPLAGQRLPRPGEICECGEPAVIVYITEKFGDVPFCGTSSDSA